MQHLAQLGKLAGPFSQAFKLHGQGRLLLALPQGSHAGCKLLQADAMLQLPLHQPGCLPMDFSHVGLKLDYGLPHLWHHQLHSPTKRERKICPCAKLYVVAHWVISSQTSFPKQISPSQLTDTFLCSYKGDLSCDLGHFIHMFLQTGYILEAQVQMQDVGGSRGDQTAWHAHIACCLLSAGVSHQGMTP